MMRSRLLQVAILIALGVVLGLLLMRANRTAEPAPAVQLSTPAPIPPPKDADVPPPSAAARSFKLPAMRAPITEPASKVEPAKQRATVEVPKYWRLTGTAPQNYDLLSDRDHVMSGEASLLIKAHPTDISTTLTGAATQSAVADPLVGKRVEVSAFLRAEEVRERTVSLWFRALDLDERVVAMDNSVAHYSKITSEWTRVRIVVDVPLTAGQVSYGVALTGKGAVWVDDFRLTPVDPTVVEPTSTGPARQLGQRSETTRLPQPRSENLDFEDTTEVALPVPLRERDDSVTAIRE